MRCTPSTSCCPAATRNSTPAWNSPAAVTSMKAATRWLQVEPRLGDPAPEVLARALLQAAPVHARDPVRVQDRKVVARVVHGRALDEDLLGDAIRAHAARPAQRDHL